MAETVYVMISLETFKEKWALKSLEGWTIDDLKARIVAESLPHLTVSEFTLERGGDYLREDLVACDVLSDNDLLDVVLV